MNRLNTFAVTAALSLALPFTAHALDVGVSLEMGQPGFYGRVDIGNTRPQVISPQPVIIAPGAVIGAAPIYIHAPREHQKKWRKYCKRYDACGRPVYFVTDHWYNGVYVPAWQARHGHGAHGKGKDKKKGDKQ